MKEINKIKRKKKRNKKNSFIMCNTCIFVIFTLYICHFIKMENILSLFTLIKSKETREEETNSKINFHS